MNLLCQGQKSTFNNTKCDIIEDRYLSQDLTSILHNTPLDVSCGREGGWGLPLHHRRRHGKRSQLRSSKCLVYQGADNAFWLCTGRTDVKRKLTTDVCLESQTKNLKMYSSRYFVPFSCQMVVMKGLTYHMIGHCNKLHYSAIFHTRSV